jgi:hypothetical protein
MRERDSIQFKLGNKAIRERCHSCEVMYINGVRCHETGCPDAWKDTMIPCFECGCDFLPTENPGSPSTRRYAVCPDCREGE